MTLVVWGLQVGVIRGQDIREPPWGRAVAGNKLYPYVCLVCKGLF